MHSLYLSSTGGSDWADIALPLREAGAHYYIIFVFYIGFFMFVVMNTLTSLFVDATLQYSQKDEDDLIYEQLHQKEEYMHKITGLFVKIRGDSWQAGDEITYEEFGKHLHDASLV